MATVLKRSKSPAEQPSGLAGFNMKDLADQGREQIDNCQRQIEQLLADAKAEAKRIHEDAYKTGYETGLKKATSEIDEKISEVAETRARSGLDLIRSTIDQIQSSQQEWMEQYADSLSQVALAATKRIVLSQLKLDPTLIVRWAESAVSSVRAATELTVAVNPETLALLGQEFDEMLAMPGMPEKTKVVPDETVGPQEVVVRQTGGEIHAGLEAQLERLTEVLS